MDSIIPIAALCTVHSGDTTPISKEVVMNEETRNLLRGIASKSILDPYVRKLQGFSDGGTYLCIEWNPVASREKVVVCICVHQQEAFFLREHFAEEHGWIGRIDCHPRMIRAYLHYLARLGLWELNDFATAEELLDGEFFILRAKQKTEDLIFPLEIDACLFCPEQALSPNIRRIGRHLRKLLMLTKESIVKESRWYKYRLGWLRSLFL
jgi:hypothetical protein